MFTYRCIIEYVWNDGNGELRSKIRVMNIDTDEIDNNEIDKNIFLNNTKFIWNYDGSSCKQANNENSEVLLKPVAIYNNPLLKMEMNFDSSFNNNKDEFTYLLLCESIDKNGKNVTGSNYQYAKTIFENNQTKDSQIWFGIEQEYFFINPDTKLPNEFVKNNNKANKKLLQGPYYCGVGGNNMYWKERNIAEKHMSICLKMNIQISGINAEVAPSQWEYQVGPCLGIDGANDLWTSRYILKRIAEKEKYDITFHPKPIRKPEFEELWNGSGCHINVSTKESREINGIEIIYKYIDLLKNKHKEHMKVYGEDNNYRLTGNHETGNINEFTHGIGSRNSSIRIPNATAESKCGYFEDRRPASNIDPYLACGIIAKTILL